ncbi:hypothetical protein Chor_011490 [Crotalus horridus]
MPSHDLEPAGLRTREASLGIAKRQLRISDKLTGLSGFALSPLYGLVKPANWKSFFKALQLQRTLDVQDKIPATETVSNVSAGDKWNKLRRFLCKPHCDNSTGNLKLCPKDWELHENKCYWISRGKQTWTKSRGDCRAQNSELAVLKEQAELVNTNILSSDRNV